jgi:peptide/nickel transport system substrate-binding protein
MDKLIMAERSATSENERRNVFRQMSVLMNEDAAYVPWHYTSDFKGLSPRVQGFEHAADGIIAFHDLSLVAG